MLCNKPNSMPKRGECGIVWGEGRDGRAYCIYRSGTVTPEKCAACERRPLSMRERDEL